MATPITDLAKAFINTSFDSPEFDRLLAARRELNNDGLTALFFAVLLEAKNNSGKAV